MPEGLFYGVNEGWRNEDVIARSSGSRRMSSLHSFAYVPQGKWCQEFTLSSQFGVFSRGEVATQEDAHFRATSDVTDTE